MNKWNGKRFSIYDSEEKQMLGLVKKLGDQTNYNTDEVERLTESDNKKVSHQEMQDTYKIDKQANFTGSWHGIEKPTQANEGITFIVEDLQKEIPGIKNNLSNKMDKDTRDIGIYQINKNLGKIDETFLTDELLQAISGNAPISQTLKDRIITTLKLTQGAVYPNNTNFIKTKNTDLFANTQFISEKAISDTTGEEVVNTAYKVTDFITVEVGKTYRTTQSNNMAYYNEQKVFLQGVKGGTWTGSFTVPTGAKYVRLTYSMSNIPYLYEVDPNAVYNVDTLVSATTEFEKLIKRLGIKSRVEMPLKSDLLKSIFDNSSLVSYKELKKGGYYTKDGWNVSENYNSSPFIEVSPNTTYWANETNIVVMYDENFIPIKQIWGSSQWNGKTFTTTDITKYVTLNFTIANIQPLFVKGATSGTSEEYINSNFIDLLISTLKAKNKKIPINSIAPFVVNKNTSNLYDPTTDEGLNTAIRTVTGVVYTVEGYQASGFIEISGTHLCCGQRHNIAFYDENKTFLSGTTGGWTNPMTIPPNAKYVRVTFALSSSTPRQINLGTELLPYEDPNKVIVSIDDSQLGIALKKILGGGSTTQSKLNGIVWNVMGDSLSSTNYSRPNWWEIIRDKYEMVVNNYGISGTTLAHTDERHLWDYDFKKLDATAIGYNSEDPSTWTTGNCMCERYVKMTDNADLITVMGSTNDGSVKLGTWDSTDTSTTYGALNVLIKGLITKYPNKKIAFFTPIQSATAYTTNVANPGAELDKKTATDTTSLQLKAEAIKRKCKQYGIPCLDLFNTSGINGVEGRKDVVFRPGDTLHPSVEGNKVMATVIENFILSLF